MSELDNVSRWDPSTRGVYEVWYTTWNHPGTGQGYWLRFIIDVPAPGSGGAPPFGEARRGELWFARFDPARPERTFGIHKRFPSELATTSGGPFKVEIAGCELGNDHTFGALAGGGHDLRWDLRWLPSPTTQRFFPDVAYRGNGIAEHMVLAPNPRVAMTGTVTVDGERLEFDGALGGQSHVWGTKHGHSWLWAHCNDFLGSSDVRFELIGARLMRRGLLLPKLTMISLMIDGEELSVRQLRHLLGNRASWQPDRVTFRGRSSTVRIEGELTCAPDRMVNAPYVDPDGAELWCANTEIADARITVWRRRGVRWVEARRLEARGRAHYEVGGRVRDASVSCPHALVT